MKLWLGATILVLLAGLTAVVTLIAKKDPIRQKLLAAAVCWLSMLAFAAVWAVIAFFA